MALMSESMHHFVQAKVKKAAEIIADAHESIPMPGEYPNFDEAQRVLAECQEALAASCDVDEVARTLRTAAAELGQLCGGPAEASVNAAIGLLDQAIGGETM
jgi:hypothetical protein